MLPDRNHKNRIISINLPEDDSVIDGLLSKRDRDIALKDLIENSQFLPANDHNGPYHIDLSIQENRLILTIKNQEKKNAADAGAILTPL